MLAAGLVPHPPLLVPELAAGAAAEVAPLLTACDNVVAGLLARHPRTVVLIGPGRETGRRADRDTGTLAGFGTRAGPAPSSVPAFPIEDDAPPLALSLTIGRWLLARAGWAGDTVLQEVAADAPAADCERLGRELAAATGPDSVWLALGDGSNRRGPRSPGHDDPRAAAFDAEIARAFETADLKALLAVDSGLAAELGASGRAVWPVLAGAVGADPGWAAIAAGLHYDDAPFGVEYLVADWAPRSGARS